ncbi:guanine deaminase [Mesorhizobium sp.]|uniref:guanine deaminase n=1 Tax=Mesorhizobium sp. TaxID=1871066 RepID=UPI0025D78DBE|nr:guanine deaminase [Mesorhizobium sp.]
MEKVFCGTAFHTPERGVVEMLRDVTIVVDNNGTIQQVLDPNEPGAGAAQERARQSGRFNGLGPTEVLIPGLVDLHIHAPQWPQLGKALDAPLEAWLQKYTFPLESRYEDLEFAQEIYTDLVATLLANGTTTAVYFATIHVEASLLLARICLERGQRAFVGKVAMDDKDQCPDFYRDASCEAGISETRAFIERLRALAPEPDPLVQPIITPRFIPSCSNDLLEGLGRLASQYDCRVQTHCSESDWETAFVQSRFGKTDTQVLADYGLLREGTILAHANFVCDEDLDLIRKNSSAVAHCPLSNVYFANAVFPLRTALDRGVRVGLGTDISGGYSASVLDACRHALIAGRMRNGGVDPTLPMDRRGIPGSTISAAEAFWVATRGGAEALGINAGKFAPGQKFDAVSLDLAAPSSNLRIFPGFDSDADCFEKIALNATRANISAVWVNGSQVCGTAPRTASMF